MPLNAKYRFKSCHLSINRKKGGMPNYNFILKKVVDGHAAEAGWGKRVKISCKILRTCQRCKWEIERRKRWWSFFEACQVYGSPQQRSSKAVGEVGQDLGWEVRVWFSHSNKKSLLKRMQNSLEWLLFGSLPKFYSKTTKAILYNIML